MGRSRCAADAPIDVTKGLQDDAPDTLDTERILNLLPHRYPFLLVDRVMAIRGDESCIGVKNVTFNEPCFQGHFPGRPVMPGVLLIEGMAQTAGAVCALSRGYRRPPKSVFFEELFCSLLEALAAS